MNKNELLQELALRFRCRCCFDGICYSDEQIRNVKNNFMWASEEKLRKIIEGMCEYNCYKHCYKM